MQVQAAVMLQPGQIEIREFEKPTPADDALLLQIDRVGICGVINTCISGTLP